MPLDTPFCLGPFAVDAQGRLRPRRPGVAPGFVVRWCGRPIHARLDQFETQACRLLVQVILGRIPSTANAAAGSSRPYSFNLLHDLRRGMPADWYMRLLPDHRVLLEAQDTTPSHMTASGLITQMTVLLLVLAPYLDVLDDARIVNAAGPGIANTCPG